MWRPKCLSCLLVVVATLLFPADAIELNCTNIDLAGTYTVSDDILCDPSPITVNVASSVTISVLKASTLVGIRFAVSGGGSLEFVGEALVLAQNSAPGADSGGAINCGNSTIAFNAPTTFSQNLAYNGVGGAIYNDACSITFAAATRFDSNKAIWGGAILNTNVPGSVIFFGGPATFDSNNGYDLGGAIANSGLVHFLAAATFHNNFLNILAKSEGGALYNGGGSILFSAPAEFDGNTAAAGGAIYNNQNFPDDGTTMTFGDTVTFDLNSAVYSGGAVFNAGTFTTESTATFTGNAAQSLTDGAGGGFANAPGGVAIFQTTTVFDQNKASAGGSVFNDAGASLTYYCKLSGPDTREVLNFVGVNLAAQTDLCPGATQSPSLSPTMAPTVAPTTTGVFPEPNRELTNKNYFKV